MQNKVLNVIVFLKTILALPLKGLSQIPITLSMLCLLWSELEELLNQTITEIYDAALLHLAKHKQVKYENEELDIQSLKNHIQKSMLQIGKVAINALFEDKLAFHANEFDPRVLDEACHLRLLSKERIRSKLNPVQQVTFIHKTYQEYCAAIYLSHLLVNDKDSFFSYLNKIQVENIKDMQNMLQFCCAKSREAAEIILEYAVRLSCNMIRTDTETDWRRADTATHDDRWDIPLALLYATKSQHLHTYLMPLFNWQTLLQCSRVTVRLSKDSEKHRPFGFFLGAVANTATSLANMYAGVTEASIGFSYEPEWLSVSVKQLFCLPTSLQSLSVTEFTEEYMEVLTVTDLPCKEHITSLSLLKDLDKLIFMGRGVPSWHVQVFLSQLPSLRKLDFMGEYLPNVSHMLTCVDAKQITTLGINSAKCVWIEAISPYISGVHALSLIDCIRDEDVDSLFSALLEEGSKLNHSRGSYAQATFLPCEDLYLRKMKISSTSANKLKKALKYFGNLKKLRLVDFEALDGGSVIFRGLRHLQELEELDLSFCQIDVRGGAIIGRNLTFIRELKSLNLHQTNFVNAELCLGLKHLDKLESLNMNHTQIDEDAVYQLDLSLAYTHDLQELVLGGTKIGKAMPFLCHGLQSLTNLQALLLINTDISDEGICQLPLSALTRLIELCIDGENPQYGGRGVEHLFRSLWHLEKLQNLRLNCPRAIKESSAFLKECYQTCSLRGETITPNIDNVRLLIESLTTARKRSTHSLV